MQDIQRVRKEGMQDAVGKSKEEVDVRRGGLDFVVDVSR